MRKISIFAPFHASPRAGEGDRAHSSWAWWWGILLAVFLPLAAHAQQKPLLDATPWTGGGTDSVTATATPQADGGVRLDYAITGAGYAYLTHPLDFDAPPNFVIDIPLSGDGVGNNLEIKFANSTGDSVWWTRRPGFTGHSEVLHIRPRHISFAWGPATDKTFHGGKSLQLVVVKSDKGAASGSLIVGPITWHEEPAPPAVEAPLKADQSSIVDGNAKTLWQARAGESAMIDLSRVRDFGGVELDWQGAAPDLTVAVSDDGQTWRQQTQRSHDRTIDLVPLGETDARYIRVTTMTPGALAEVSLLPLAEGSDKNALLTHAAKLSPRGDYPRAFLGEQPYWTVVGVPGGGSRSSLLSENGAVELGPEGPSLEPFLKIGNKRLTWADVKITQGLEGDLPLPWVQWQTPGARLKVSPAAFGDADHPYALVCYAITNTRRTAQVLTLDLDLRPIQVNPPAQFLNRLGGASSISDLTLAPDVATVNGQAALYPLDAPTSLAANRTMGLDQATATVHDPDGLAHGTYDYVLKLKAGETRTVSVLIPLSEQRAKVAVPAIATIEKSWRDQLATTQLTLPRGTPPIASSLNLSLAYVLELRDHDLLKPGARSYDRSWIRDGAMMSEGLMRMGHFDEARRYFEAYSQYLFDTGKVPCCVDGRGADPLPENDSHGEFAWLAGELVRYGWNLDEAKQYWPKVKAALAYQESMRQSTRIPENQTPENAAYYGLMPPSIGHEGYFDKAAYSYWDDFWALKGYRGGIIMAHAVGDEATAQLLTQQADQFAAELKASLVATAKNHNLDILAGSADRGDYDPTSSTMGLTAGAHANDVPGDLARNTWDAYWKQITDRQTTPKSYVPYELRNVAVFLRLKEPERARTALQYLFNDQAMPAWHEWAEVVAVPRRNVTFIGDLPHGWVESDYMRSALDLFAYERPETQAMVLLSGFDPKWTRLGETRLDRLHTPYGELSLSVHHIKGALVLDYQSTVAPPGGFVIDLNALGGASATVDGQPATVSADGELTVHAARATVKIMEAKP